MAAAVSPVVLGMIGRELIRAGEVVFAIDMSGNGLRLTPAVDRATYRGLTSDPSGWTYEVDDAGPTGQRRRVLTADGVLHCRYADGPDRTLARGVAHCGGEFNRLDLGEVGAGAVAGCAGLCRVRHAEPGRRGEHGR